MDRTVAAWAPGGKGLALYDILSKISQWLICRQLIEKIMQQL
jgi:hypothetical protein